MSTESCLSPPWVGQFITVTKEDDTKLKLTCEKEEHFFFMEDLNYPSELEVNCVQNFAFGGKFPYWEIPGMNYPKTTELYCVNARICRDFSDLRNKMDPLGFMDNFDEVNSEVGDTFQYSCSMEGRRGERDPTRSSDDIHFSS